ncbi:MAG TPA: DUF732 domain-containing protein [Mycobacteriales bacterium]|nr:DUF732 domain-containing protein [Mycobacteriales bacterium]
MNGQTTRTAIATGTCVTLGVALSVALGIVPQATAHADSGTRQVAHGVGADVPFRQLFEVQHLAQTPQLVAPAARAHHASATKPAAVTSAVQPGTSQASSAHIVSAEAATSATKHPVKHHHKKKAHHKKKKAHHKAKSSAPKLAARTRPSEAAISSAITGLKNYVRTPFSPSAAQVAEFGDDVCSAFDQNESLSHVEALILAKVKQLPFTTVLAGAANYVVKTAVKLYCPGYTSRLG